LSNKIFRNELEKEIQAAMKSYEDAADLDHLGLRGRVREIVTEKLLSPILPPGIEIGTGKITNSKSNFSAETDLIIYT